MMTADRCLSDQQHMCFSNCVLRTSFTAIRSGSTSYKVSDEACLLYIRASRPVNDADSRAVRGCWACRAFYGT